MNDPNGLVWCDGEYHLYYQAEPTGQRPIHNGAGSNIGWGHAVSRDLVHWEEQAMALPFTDTPERLAAAYSGSAVLDAANSAGLAGADCASPLVAFYTEMRFVRDADRWLPDSQPVCMAYSLDGGRTFTAYEGNPVVPVTERKFGDPKVFWHAESQRWIMVNIRGMEQGRIEFYGSRDLRSWALLSDFRSQQPGAWECPDLFPLAVDDDPARVRWILKYNAHNTPRHYVLGDFDGRRFIPERELPAPVIGTMYAEVTFNNIPGADGRRILIGWIPEAPDANRPWVGMQSMPRELALTATASGEALIQRPVREFRALRGERLRLTPSAAASLLPDMPSAAVEIQVDCPRDAETALVMRLSDGALAEIVMLPAVSQLAFRCGDREVSMPFGGLKRGPEAGNRCSWSVFLDCGVVEVFSSDGSCSLVAPLGDAVACESLDWRGTGAEVSIWPLVGV
jgi:sucrose-6-phosphate hydrolase SacC (GH32 family)